MHKVTHQAVNAFNNNQAFKSGNTTVELSPLGYMVVMKLHGHAIARKDIEKGTIEVTSAGWETTTTKERLNGLNGIKVNQKSGQWYLNGNAWHDSSIWTEV
tara:strand:+ start:88833 stop:89135 length:303 start_codon:yes stop_codon:yes gene_type:complete